MNRKNMLVVLIALASLAVFAAMPRSEWHAKVGECALDPVVLKATISQLSSEDKAAFLAEVNEAISKMPGSAEVKAAQFLAANRAAVAGAGSSDRAPVLAEVFATVPPESLTVIIEEFSKNEFARSDMMDDKRFVAIVKSAMEKIVQRCSSAESGGIRASIAGLMFVKAAGSAENAARDTVIAALPSEVRHDARNNWYPAALGKDGEVQSYDSMLATAQAGEEPNHMVVVGIYPQQMADSMLADLQAGVLPGEDNSRPHEGNQNIDFYNGDVDAIHVKLPTPSRDRVENPTIPESLITGDPADKDKPLPNPGYTGDRDDPVVPGEPGPYWLQRL